MATFGSFETTREVYAGTDYSVYGARKAGDSAEYAIKVFAVRAEGMDSESAEVLGPLLADLENSCLERVNIQQRAAESSKHISPVLERGQDERGVWYATNFYPRSANLLITRKVELNAAQIEHIIHSVVQGALDLKRICGRSHGEIQPTNIQISKDDLAEADVVLSDPLPGAASEAARFEKADLRAIGELIYQLVMRRGAVDFQWILLPLESSPEWAATFGKKEGARWLELCSRLLDPNLSLERTNLESAARELKPSGAPKGLVKIGAIAAGVVVLGAIAFFFLRRPSSPASQPVANIPSTSAPATAETSKPVVVTPPVDQRFKTALTASEQAYAQAEAGLAADITGDVVNQLVAARTKIVEALTYENTNKTALELQDRIKSDFENAYQGATDRANKALTDKNGGERSTNYATLALRLKPNDPVAGDLLKRGLLQRDKELQAKDCNEARNQADQADRDGNWADAKQKWQRARDLCGPEREILDGLKFADAIIKVTAALKDAEAKSHKTVEDAQQAKQLCDDTLKLIDSDEIARLSTEPPSRTKSYREQKNYAETIRNTAVKWIADSKLRATCEKLRADALAAENKKAWSDAYTKWHDLIQTCGENAEATAGAEFSSTLSKIVQRLAADKPGTVMSFASARAATNDYPRAIKDLDKLINYTNGSAPRTAELDSKRTEALAAQTAAANAIKELARVANCSQAKTNALSAETRRDWLEASNQWALASSFCGRDTDPAAGMQLAGSMLSANSDITAAERESLSDQASADRAKASSISAAQKLAAAKRLANTGARSAAVDEQTKRAQSVQARAEKAIQQIMAANACQDAKIAATAAENQTNWTLASQKLTQATNICPDDPDARSGAAFAHAITNASAKVAQAQELVDKNDATGQGAQLCDDAEKVLSPLPTSQKSDVRRSALSTLKNRVKTLRLASDQAFANALFVAGKYDEALKICNFYDSEKSMADLKQAIAKEQTDLKTFTDQFARGDYSFLSQTQPYARKAAFANIISTGTLEKAALDRLIAMTNANNWNGVITEHNGSAGAGYWNKPAFAQVLSWANGAQADYNTAVLARLQKMDVDLVCLADMLGFGKNADVQALRPRGMKPCDTITTDIGLDDKANLLKEVTRLRSEYGAQLLAEKNRAGILDRAKKNIDNR